MGHINHSDELFGITSCCEVSYRTTIKIKNLICIKKKEKKPCLILLIDILMYS